MTTGTETSPAPAAENTDRITTQSQRYQAMLRRHRQIRRRMAMGAAGLVGVATATMATVGNYHANASQRHSDLNFLAAPDKFGSTSNMKITGTDPFLAALPFVGGDTPQVVVTLQDCPALHLKFGLAHKGTPEEALTTTVHQTDTMPGAILSDRSIPVTIGNSEQLAAFEAQYVVCPPAPHPKETPAH